MSNITLKAGVRSNGAPSRRLTLTVTKAIAVSALALLAAGCKESPGTPQVAGWTLVDPSQRHPILVSQKPTHMQIRVSRGSHGLTPSQRADVLDFAARFRATDAGNSRLIISAPSGSANEVAAMHAVQDIRGLLDENGFPETAITVEAYHIENDPQPPVRVSYLRYVAEAPECGYWPTNLANEPGNLPYANFGCATQRNLAAHIANPADLLGPRTETARASERRGTNWDKYVKGETSGATRSSDERVDTRTQN
ncbi:MAG: pilus assembly protein CpaD [Hyphomicrobium sp.]|nr:MAG: pilus assembly protein CpaD [Hyphomicrobium sp.]